jgi:hypothetical protein
LALLLKKEVDLALELDAFGAEQVDDLLPTWFNRMEKTELGRWEHCTRHHVALQIVLLGVYLVNVDLFFRLQHADKVGELG